MVNSNTIRSKIRPLSSVSIIHQKKLVLPRCPSTEEWIQKMWYIYTMEYYSAIKKNEFMKFRLSTLNLRE
jgi:hypothetical protein